MTPSIADGKVLQHTSLFVNQRGRVSFQDTLPSLVSEALIARSHDIAHYYLQPTGFSLHSIERNRMGIEPISHYGTEAVSPKENHQEPTPVSIGCMVQVNIVKHADHLSRINLRVNNVRVINVRVCNV
jgi:hypothetical protein